MRASGIAFQLHLYSGEVSKIYEYIPPECLPKDFGGELDCLEILHGIIYRIIIFINFNKKNIIFTAHKENNKIKKNDNSCNIFIKKTLNLNIFKESSNLKKISKNF